MTRLLPIFCLLLILAGGVALWFARTAQADRPVPPPAAALAAPAAPAASEARAITQASPARPAPEPSPAQKPRETPPVQQANLRLGGSNTIGERLGPELVAGFFRQIGCTDMKFARSAPGELRIDCHGNGHSLLATIAAHGTSTGFSGLIDGHYDIGMASRPIKAGEARQMMRIGESTPGMSEMVVGLDGIAIVTHPRNRVAQLTIEQLAQIFAGAITDWQQVGGAAGPIHLFARDEQSGTWDLFQNLVLVDRPLSPAARRFEDGVALVDSVLQDEAAIGFVGIGAIGGAKTLALSHAIARAQQPDRFSIATEDYPLSRRLMLYGPTVTENQYIVPFLRFANSPEGQAIVEKIGFVPLTITRQNSQERVKAAPVGEPALLAHATRLSVDFRFRDETNELDTRSLADLDRVIAYLRASGISGDKLILVGFSSDSGAASANQRLSELRAQIVADALTAHGINPALVRGLGAILPVADDHLSEGQIKNRRVEVWVRG